MRTDFDWRLIPTFLAALDCGSLLAAARHLGSSQPTVGRQLAELESQLNTVLFERTGRGLRPTANARALETSARQMAEHAHTLARGVPMEGVLAELLGSDEEAVSFLERHGRLRTAAELAETQSKFAASTRVSSGAPASGTRCSGCCGSASPCCCARRCSSWPGPTPRPSPRS